MKISSANGRPFCPGGDELTLSFKIKSLALLESYRISSVSEV